ncbi:MAG: asparagine synthetase B family protein, partial [Terriglobia bacterium]
IKALLEYPEIARSIDDQALREYLFLGYVPAPRSIFAGIRKLPAGCWMVAEGGQITVKPYWLIEDHLLPPGNPQPTRAKEADLVKELRTRLREAAVSRLVSDVPLGVFLSGGVDSSTLVALMSELAPGHVKTFSVTFAEKSFSEEPYSTLVAEHFHTQHHVLEVDECSLREGLNAMVRMLDEPLADPAIIPTFLISRFARPHIKVALSGEGADELFGGYPTYLGAQLARYYLRLPGFLRRQFFSRLKSLLPISSSAVPIGLFLRRFLSYAERDAAERHQTWFGMFSPEELDRIFPAAAPGHLPASRRALEPVERATEGIRFEDDLAKTLYLDFRLYLADDLLVKVDRASMACSLELRTPFLDHRLIEFAASLPVSLRVRGFQLKYLIKKAVEPWLPRQIVYRQKRGFSVPTASWLRAGLAPLLGDMLSESRLRKQGLFDPKFVRLLVEDHQQGRADNRKALWALLCFELWYAHWAKG